jgi:hypothetical protein
MRMISASRTHRISKPIANLRAPSQERGDTAGRLKQSGVFNKRYGSSGLLGFRHQQIGQGRLARLFAFRSSLGIGDLRLDIVRPATEIAWDRKGFEFLQLGRALAHVEGLR